MELIEILIVAVVSGFVCFHLGQRATTEPTEGEMIQRLIKLRADRYIGAVAKMKVENEIKDAADAQATERLAEQGVRPTNP